MAHLTKRTVDAATKGTRDQFIWDDELAGFGLKVTPAGGKIYIYQYRQPRPGDARSAPTKRYTIGKHGELTADQARKRAKELSALVSQGIDPRQSEVDAVAAKTEAKRKASELARIEADMAFSKVAGVFG